jgi:hypothetical protein
VDFKLENVLVSLQSLKTMGLGSFGASAPLFLMNGELLGHSPKYLKYKENNNSTPVHIVHNSPFLNNNGEFRQ